jgi:putative ABC transport system permease protein
MQVLLQDLRYGLRTLRKNPGSTLVAIVALGLGIGANTAIFSVINAVLIRPLPYPEPDRMVMVFGNQRRGNLIRQWISPADFEDYRKGAGFFDQLGAFRGKAAVLTGGALPERVEMAEVSPSILAMLGMKLARGRAFTPEESETGKNHVAVIGDGLWRRRFGSDPNITATALTLDGNVYQIVGVAPAGFQLLDTPSELWIPYTPDPKDLADSARGHRSLNVIGHLSPGVSIQQAGSGMAAIAHQIEERSPDTNAGCSAEVIPLKEQMVGDIRATLWTLIGAVAFVLLIACANVANLLLARAGAREKEIAVRTSLGANPSRLVRQMLTESVLLSLLGGLFGLLLAVWGVSALVHAAPAGLPRAGDISLDWRVLGFTLLVSLATGLLFGMAPAWSSLRPDLNSILKTSGRSTTGSRSRGQVRNLLVIAEIAACVVLLVGAGLLLRSFMKLSQVNPGFRTDHVLTMQLSLPASRYTGLNVAQFYQRLVERTEQLPGVLSAGVCRFLPLAGADASLNFQIEGQPATSTANQPRAKYRSNSPGYFSAMAIPLSRGRLLDRTDNERSPKVVLINEAAAHRYWPREDPVGKRILSGVDENAWSTIVGVVGNVKHSGLDSETNPETYYHYLQLPPDQMGFIESTMSLVVRTSADPTSVVAAIRNDVHSLDPGLPIFNVKTMEDVVHGSVAQPRFRTWLLGTFALLALVLAAVGLYGVISYSVTQRTSELGVRAAMGASPGDVLKLVVGQAARLAAIGIGIGLVLSVVLARSLSKFLFGVAALDPITFLGTAGVILVVTLIASYLPALRATRIDPVTALRAE